MSLGRKIELLYRSSHRMMNVIGMKRDEDFWLFLRRELWIHFKLTVSTWWMVFRRKEQ